MSSPTTATDRPLTPESTPGPPPFSRDRLAHSWLLVKALTDAGDAAWTIALAWTAVHVAGPAVAGLVVAAGTVPRALVLLIGGVLADRLPTRPVLLVTNLVRVAVLVATALWVATSSPGVAVLVVAAVAFGVCDALHEPSASTIGRQLVSAGDLPSYLALGQTFTRIGTLVGAAGGGFLVAHAGLAGAASVDAVAFALMVAFVALWLRPRIPLERAPAESMVRQVGQGFAHLATTPVTRTLVLALSGLNLAITPALSLGIPLLARQEGWSASIVGLLEAAVGAGAAAGALLVLRWRPRNPTTVGFGLLIVQAVCICVLPIGILPLAAIACVTLGVTAGVASTLLGAVFVTTVSATHFGRMVAIQRLGDDVLMPAAMAGFGVLVATVSLTGAFLAFGGAMGLMMLRPMLNPALRAIRLEGADRPPAA